MFDLRGGQPNLGNFSRTWGTIILLSPAHAFNARETLVCFYVVWRARNAPLFKVYCPENSTVFDVRGEREGDGYFLPSVLVSNSFKFKGTFVIRTTTHLDGASRISTERLSTLMGLYSTASSVGIASRAFGWHLRWSTAFAARSSVVFSKQLP